MEAKKKMSLAISTAWNSSKSQSGLKIIEEVKQLGFEEVELNFSLSAEAVEEIASLVKDSRIKVASIHNFCPMPEGLSVQEALPDCFSLASLDEEIRARAVNQTKKSLDTAEKLKAKVLVLHSGRVEIEDKTRRLIALYQNGLKDKPEYAHLKTEIIRERQDQVEPYLKQVIKSLEELTRYATELGVSLGVETRYYFREIPSFEEIEIILDKFKGRNVFYWHDTGHAQVHENLGFGRHSDFLERYSNRMIGLHLHDVSGATDHLAPGKGKFDFSMLKKYIHRETIKVMEAHQPATDKDIRQAKIYLEQVFNGVL